MKLKIVKIFYKLEVYNINKEILMETEDKKGTLLNISNGSMFLTHTPIHIIETSMMENRPIQIRSLTANMFKIVNPRCVVTAEEVYITGISDNKVFYSYKSDKEKVLFIQAPGV